MHDLENTKKIIYQLLGAIPMIKDTTRSSWANKLAPPIFFLAMVSLFLGTIFYLVSGFRSAFPNGILPQKKELNLSPKTLSYTRLEKNKKDEDGLYNNLFKITIIHPAGNTNPQNLMFFDLPPTAGCEMGSPTGVAEIGAGVATTTSDFLVSCVSKEPIIDNGRLFDIINDNEQLKKQISQPTS